MKFSCQDEAKSHRLSQLNSYDSPIFLEHLHMTTRLKVGKDPGYGLNLSKLSCADKSEEDFHLVSCRKRPEHCAASI